MRLTLVNCAVASDGGSISLIFSSEENNTLWITLDKGFASKTRNRIFTSNNGDTPLDSKQEKDLLRCLQTVEVIENACVELLDEVINEIKSRI